MKDNYDNYREQPQGCGTAIGGALAVIAIVILCIFFSSCASTSHVEKVNVRDSVAIRWHDSIRWQVRDSVNLIEHHVTLQDSSHLVIQFGQGGGTYNALTGEATNVAGVQHVNTHHEQKDSTNYFRSLAEDYQHTTDSLSEANYNLQSEIIEERKVPKRSGYDRFCSWWFWITAILLLIKVAAWVCEKIPVTAPYVMTIRRFIPFL